MPGMAGTSTEQGAKMQRGSTPSGRELARHIPPIGRPAERAGSPRPAPASLMTPYCSTLCRPLWPLAIP